MLNTERKKTWINKRIGETEGGSLKKRSSERVMLVNK